MNLRFEMDMQVQQADKAAEQILCQSLIPTQSDSAQQQYDKIKYTLQTAIVAFMNLDIEQDTHLSQSLKMLNRIPNMRICLILQMIAQGQYELSQC